MGVDKTFGNRFDDPEGEYRVLYAASDRLTCFIECLACFRPDLKLLAASKEISGPDDFAPFFRTGQSPGRLGRPRSKVHSLTSTPRNG
jgi:hypothetical protein